MPRGPKLWVPEETPWTSESTDGLYLCEFVEVTIRITKGSLAGQFVRLRHWQGDLYCDILRLNPETGRRRYTTYELWIPRKNSKSLLGSGLALDGLFDEMGAEVYSCAADKLQAKIVFQEVRAAVEQSPELLAMLKVYRDAIECPSTGSVYRALSSEAFTKEGLNPSRVLFDELHAQPNAELWNVMNQGSGTREQPLIVALSTFGARMGSDGNDSLGYQQYRYCKQVLAGEVDDPSFGCRVYETPADADHRDEANWPGANPALGDFLRVEDMRDRCQRMPEADFRTKRLNIWVYALNPWLPFGSWAACTDEREIPDGTEVVLGFDGSFSNDSTALVVATIGETPHLDVAALWERPLTAEHDWRVPVFDVEEAIRGACRRWQVREIVCDPFRWARTYQILESENLPIIEYPQSPARMVPATQRFYEAVLNKTLTHSGNADLARHIGNTTTKTDARGTRVDKPKGSAGKIDLAVAAVMAFDVATVTPTKVELRMAWA